MRICYKTKGNNAYNRRNYLLIDTKEKTALITDSWMSAHNADIEIEVKTADYKAIRELARQDAYTITTV